MPGPTGHWPRRWKSWGKELVKNNFRVLILDAPGAPVVAKSVTIPAGEAGVGLSTPIDRSSTPAGLSATDLAPRKKTVASNGFSK